MARLYNVDSVTDVVLPTTDETVVATLADVGTTRAGESVHLRANVTVTTGANTTGLVLRLRFGGLAGVVVGEAPTEQVEAIAGSTETHSYAQTHVPGAELAGATYVLTVQQVAATANGTVTHAVIDAVVS